MYKFRHALQGHTLEKQPKSPPDYPLLKPGMFYVGQLLNACSVFLFLIGTASSYWVVVDTVILDEMEASDRNRLIAHYGPWLACTWDETCRSLWTHLKLIDHNSAQLVQILIALSSATYIVGFLAMTLQLTKPAKWEKLWEKTDSLLVVEFIFPIAAIIGFIVMLMFASINQGVIVEDGQVKEASSGFYMAVSALLFSVAGSVCTVLNRYTTGKPRTALYFYSLRCRRGKLSLGSEQQPKTVVHTNDITIKGPLLEQNVGDKINLKQTEESSIYST